jgi:isopenicillin-N epimerase
MMRQRRAALDWASVLAPERQPGPHRHKWLGAPKGAGFLYVRRELQREVHPLLISWGYEGDDPSFVSRHEKQGTRDPSAYLTVPAAIAWQNEHDWDVVRNRCHELARRRAQGARPRAPDTGFR